MKHGPEEKVDVYTSTGETETITRGEYDRRKAYGGLFDWAGRAIPPERTPWAPPVVAEIPAIAVVAAIYVNHRGEEAIRRLRPVSLSPFVFRESPFHLDRDDKSRPMWKGLDADRDDDIIRDFAMTGVRAWVEASEYAR